MPDQIPFLGTGWGFPPTFVRDQSSPRGAAGCAAGRTVTVTGEADICESLEILFNTALGERVMQPGYGAALRQYVFEPMNAGFLTYIRDLIETAIVYHEPRIKTEGVTIEPEQHEGRLRIGIDYEIRGTNSRFNFVYDFYLTESGQQP